MSAGNETFVSGLGGYMNVRYPSSATSSPGSWVRCNLIVWDDQRGIRKTDNSHSGVSAANYESVMPEFSASFQASLDVSQATAAYNLTNGTKVDVQFQIGASGKYEQVIFTLLENLAIHDDNSNDIVRFSGSFSGGVLTPFS